MKPLLSETQKEFLDRRLFATIAVTHQKSGHPILLPVWVIYDKDKLYITTVKDTKKVKHLEINNKLGLSVLDPKGFPYLSISGDVSFIDENNNRFFPLREKFYAKYDADGSFRKQIRNDNKERLVIEINPKYIFGAVK